MRTGKEYESSLNDGRDVWIVGEGISVRTTCEWRNDSVESQT